MSFSINCPQCSTRMKSPVPVVGKNVKCGKCQTTFIASTADMEEIAEAKEVPIQAPKSTVVPHPPPPPPLPLPPAPPVWESIRDTQAQTRDNFNKKQLQRANQRLLLGLIGGALAVGLLVIALLAFLRDGKKKDQANNDNNNNGASGSSKSKTGASDGWPPPEIVGSKEETEFEVGFKDAWWTDYDSARDKDKRTLLVVFYYKNLGPRERSFPSVRGVEIKTDKGIFEGHDIAGLAPIREKSEVVVGWWPKAISKIGATGESALAFRIPTGSVPTALIGGKDELKLPTRSFGFRRYSDHFGFLPEKPEDAVPGLIKVVREKRSGFHYDRARNAAIVELGNIGPAAKAAVPALKELQRDDWSGAVATAALWKIDPVGMKQQAVKERQQKEGREQEFQTLLNAVRDANADKKFDDAQKKLNQAKLRFPDDPAIPMLQREIDDGRKQMAYDDAMKRARDAFKAGKYDDAIKAAKVAHDLFPSDPESFELAKQAAKAGYDDAVKRGRAAFAEGKYDDAINLAKEALRFVPFDREAEDLLSKAKNPPPGTVILRTKQALGRDVRVWVEVGGQTSDWRMDASEHPVKIPADLREHRVVVHRKITINRVEFKRIIFEEQIKVASGATVDRQLGPPFQLEQSLQGKWQAEDREWQLQAIGETGTWKKTNGDKGSFKWSLPGNNLLFLNTEMNPYEFHHIDADTFKLIGDFGKKGTRTFKRVKEEVQKK